MGLQGPIQGLYRIGTRLIERIDTAFQGKNFGTAEIWTANFILQMPLYGVDPRLLEKVAIQVCGWFSAGRSSSDWAW